MTPFLAHGKLLLTGEYLVLDGALALAIPTRYGQTLGVVRLPDQPNVLTWRSLDERGQAWFEGQWEWQTESLHLRTASDAAVAERLTTLFTAAYQLEVSAGARLRGVALTTQLDFPREWGLGSSSTLVSLLAQYLDLNPYALLADTFGGSGYDVACATAAGPILYLRLPEKPLAPQVLERPDWFPPYARQICLVYLGHKQDSRAGIQLHRSKGAPSPALIEQVNHLTFDLLEATDTDSASAALRAHEALLAKWLGVKPVQQTHFSDFPGVVKSLGAWGGDFVLALSHWPAKKNRAYFNERGYQTVLNFEQVCL